MTTTSANVATTNPPQQQQITQKMADVFPDFKPKQQNQKQNTGMDFEVLWSTRQPEKKTLNFDFFQMNSDSSGVNKKQI